MSHQDWEPVGWNKPKSGTKPPSSQRIKKHVAESDDPPPPPSIDHQLKTILQKGRIAKGLSQKALAKQLNLQESLIGSYESGKGIPDKQILRKIAKALNIKLK